MMKTAMETSVNISEGLILMRRWLSLRQRLISRCQHTMILKVILIIFPKNNPEAPNPPYKKPIVEARQMQVVMMEKKLYLVIDSLPLAKRKAQIIPLKPKKTTKIMQVLKAQIVQEETHFSPQRKVRKISEQLNPKLTAMIEKWVTHWMKLTRACTDSPSSPLLKQLKIISFNGANKYLTTIDPKLEISEYTLEM